MSVRQLQQLMVLHLLLSLGCAGTRWALQEQSINFHITHGFKQSPASAQDLVLIRHPPSSRREPSLSCAHCGCPPNKGSCRAAPVPGALVLCPAAGSTPLMSLPGEHWGLG